MPLPPRPFEALNDLAIRWAVVPIDIVGWATDEQILLLIAVPPVRTETSRVVCDLVEIAGTDVLPLFRPEGVRLEKVHIRRVRTQGDTEWQWISEPTEGITVGAADILVTRAEVQRFERKHGPLGSEQPGQPARRRTPGPGAPARYDWGHLLRCDHAAHLRQRAPENAGRARP
jgi:hypothetical protein